MIKRLLGFAALIAISASAGGQTPVEAVQHRVGTAVLQGTTSGVLQNVTNVRMYGAAGNGTTDDTAAIQKAITASQAGSRIYFPAGTYLISSSLTVNQDEVLYGDGYSSILLGTFGSAGTDMIIFGTSGTIRSRAGVESLSLQFSSTNCRNVISVVANTQQFVCDFVDIRSQNTANFQASGAGISLAGNGLSSGPNDWPLFKHCYIAHTTKGIVISGVNVINARITQCTFTSISGAGVYWTLGGQSQIDNNTFQNCNLTAVSAALYLNGTTLASSVVNNVEIGPGNSFQNNGTAGAGTADCAISFCYGINIIANQFESTETTGAYVAVALASVYGNIIGNTWQAYNKGGSPGAVTCDSMSQVGYYNNPVVNGFEIQSGAGAGLFNRHIGTVSILNPAGSEIFRFDTGTNTAMIPSITLTTGGISYIKGGEQQLASGAATVSCPGVLTGDIVQVTSATCTGTPGATSINQGAGTFLVTSTDGSDAGYFYWRVIR